MDDIEETTVTSATACSWLGIDRSTLTRWVQAGHITPAFKYPGSNGAYLFERAEVERIQRERTAATAR
ncbi:helix-turn-helix domain-containing protein [Cellulosimicrobium sp. I38E]|uniref:helix-turn-helix domain-containing protein n=1 Tax=Cellulosimicrobium sp. I38E TaxID=1393139 RepID=UPI000A6AF204|nr:helix-turn-helix domain-containing protein [Cellulosimicrobium sp. I38E]